MFNNYDLITESEAIDNYYCMYVLEAEEVSDKKNNARQIGIFERLTNFFKKIIEKTKNFFNGNKKDKINDLKGMNIQGEDREGEEALKRMGKFADKQDVTDQDIEQANKDLQTIKSLPEKQDTLLQRYKDELKTGKGKARFAIVSTGVVYDFYMEHLGGLERGNKKYAKQSAKLKELAKKGYTLDDKEIKKVLNAEKRSMILYNSLNAVSTLSSRIQATNSVINKYAVDKLNKRGHTIAATAVEVGHFLPHALNSVNKTAGTANNILRNIKDYDNQKKEINYLNKMRSYSNDIIDTTGVEKDINESAYDAIMRAINII